MSEGKYRILLVEDDTTLGYLLTEYLQLKGLEVSWATDGKKALHMLASENYDLAVLDVMMPEMDGFALAGNIQKLYPGLLFIFLTAKSLKVDVLKGFSLGAADYLKKPIDEEELVVRIRALLSRNVKNQQLPATVDTHQLGSYTFNHRNQELQLGGDVIHLTTRENELLHYLINRKNQLCSHKDILLALWGRYDYFNKKSLNVFVTHLRKYLEKDSNVRIDNVHGQGFILRSGDTES